jgi:hypothetical protein
LQSAVRAEIRRLDLLEAADDYLTELGAEVPAASAAERERADIVARRLGRRR